MNPLKLLDLSYLFDVHPGSTFMYFWPLLILFIVLFVSSFKVGPKGIASRMREFSVVGLLLTFLRDQNIPYLGMRIWLVLLFLAAVAYGIWYWKDLNKKANMKPAVEEQKQADKYLPKKKGKKKKSKRK
ncbi:MAG: hypothetical protein WC924_02090 [Candidatus Gracilibacteria bacterium]